MRSRYGRRAFRASPIRCVGERIKATGVPEFREVAWRACPFSLIGAMWLLYFLEYNLSIAVWVGMIALAGLAAEMGVLMMLYLGLSCEQRKAENRLQTAADLSEAIVTGASQRIRPMLMTSLASFIGLLPILWSAGAGADVMKRIAAPMVGGIASALIMVLIVFPAVYSYWKGWQLR